MLSAYRVLDLCDERGALAGKILAELGADVIKVEAPGGDPARRRGPFLEGREHPDRSLAWLALNTSKRSVTIDLAAADGQDLFRRLVATSDVVIESFAPGTLAGWGLSYAELCAGLPEDHPGLVCCSITPFGQHGPWARYAAHDLVIVALGGNAAMTGDPERPPLRCSLPTAYLHAAPEAAIGVGLALYAREELGRGQLVDVSMHECQLATLVAGVGQYALGSRAGRRSGARTGRTREIWRCRDGWVSYGLRGGPARAASLAATVEYMAESGMAPAWLRSIDWATYDPMALDTGELARVEDAFAAFFESRSMRELYEQALARRILLAPCNDAREILAQPQLRARGFFRRLETGGPGPPLEHPAFFAIASQQPIGLRFRAPRAGEHDAEIRRELAEAPRRPVRLRPPSAAGLATRVDAAGVLSGLKVLELGSGAAGPVATRYLAEQGATVVRIESSRRPDFLRVLHVTAANRALPDVLERAPMYVLLNPNKKSLAIDMKRREGVELVKRLVVWADVVAENFAPGVMERWGLSYETLRALQPRLVMLSGCLFGQTGPQRSYPGFGGQGAAIAGFNHLTGWPDGEALGPYATITDSLAPRYGAAALVAALVHLRRSGEGGHIDLSQIEAGVYSLSEVIVRHSATGEVMTRVGNRDEDAAPHGIYPCRGEDGRERWIAIAVQSDRAWQALAAEMGDPAWARDERLASRVGRLAHQDELDARIADWSAGQRASELMARLQARGVEAGVVQDFADLVGDPQLAARGHYVRIDHDPLGTLLFERSGFRLCETPGRLTSPGPRLGQHTDEILSEVLGLSGAEIAKLHEQEITV